MPATANIVPLLDDLFSDQYLIVVYYDAANCLFHIISGSARAIYPTEVCLRFSRLLLEKEL